VLCPLDDNDVNANVDLAENVAVNVAVNVNVDIEVDMDTARQYDEVKARLVLALAHNNLHNIRVRNQQQQQQHEQQQQQGYQQRSEAAAETISTIQYNTLWQDIYFHSHRTCFRFLFFC